MADFNTAIHFDGVTNYSSTDYRNGYPISTGMRRYSNGYDWVDCNAELPGKKQVSLYCRSIPSRRIEDFYEFFSKNEFVWYKLFLFENGKIFNILKIKSYKLVSANVINTTQLFPSYVYNLSSFVEQVIRTDDRLYKTYESFNINY
ncbi:MAG: hypothetical protein ACOCV1_02390 [Bacillota bacterium]